MASSMGWYALALSSSTVGWWLLFVRHVALLAMLRVER